MELSGFEQLGELDPMVDVVEAVGFVFGVSPESWGLMAAALELSARSTEKKQRQTYTFQQRH